jgi:hypothetical protein
VSCKQCHSTERWKPATFDHDKFFVLDSNHNPTCVTCHANNDYSRYHLLRMPRTSAGQHGSGPSTRRHSRLRKLRPLSSKRKRGRRAGLTFGQ